MKVNKLMFREYDIRGIYGEDIDEEVSYLIGRAFASKLTKLGLNKTVLAHDNRLSSPVIKENLLRGLIDSGITVYDLGLASTPMCYFATNYYNVNTSMMITASHNPKEYNGFKFSYNGIHNAFGDQVREIYDIIERKDFVDGQGKVIPKDIRSEYIKLLTSNIKLGKRKIKVVYDCGNGTTSIIADDIFKQLNVEAIPLYNISDGSFPNHHPDPCVEENNRDLKEMVIKNKADLGVGFDGDGDRVGVIDEKGNMIDIDKYMIIMWRYLCDKVNKKEGFFDVKCTKALEDELIILGVKPVETRTGNSYTRKISHDGNYPLGGELSGHVYYRDKFPGYDDGIYAGLRIVERLSHTNEKLSELLNGINKYYSTKELKIQVEDTEKFKIIDKVKEYAINKNYNIVTLDGVKVKFDDGFALVRASNTGPNITMRYEGNTRLRLKEIEDEFNNVVDKIIKEVNK
ncbi:MAG: phosphomannomutase/phosphoglucomutase [Bacilli bacterium]|nr:phosphomannomutase/phosphoglucomutase [Bacilli bacterium]